MAGRVARSLVVLVALAGLLHWALVWRHPLLRSATWDIIQLEAGKLLESAR